MSIRRAFSTKGLTRASVYYREVAAALEAKAAREQAAEMASQLENLAHCYDRLSEQADFSAAFAKRMRDQEGA